jgi:hypothetical protein
MEQGGVKAGTRKTCIRIVQGEGVLALYNGVGLIKRKHALSLNNSNAGLTCSSFHTTLLHLHSDLNYD